MPTLKEKFQDEDYRADATAAVFSDGRDDWVYVLELVDEVLALYPNLERIKAKARQIEACIHKEIEIQHIEATSGEAEYYADAARETAAMESHWDDKYGDAA